MHAYRFAVCAAGAQPPRARRRAAAAHSTPALSTQSHALTNMLRQYTAMTFHFIYSTKCAVQGAACVLLLV
eukprot:SAG25_NODE_52_length_18732_cov_99.030484_10_plen_71_part_00